MDNFLHILCNVVYFYLLLVFFHIFNYQIQQKLIQNMKLVIQYNAIFLLMVDVAFCCSSSPMDEKLNIVANFQSNITNSTTETGKV